MKPFLFRLERILRLRADHERERARSLGEARADEREQRAAVDRAEARLEQLREELANATERVANAGTLRNLGLTVAAATEEIEKARAQFREAQASADAEQERYGEARRERRVVERLRELRHASWREDETRSEQKDADGMTARRHHEQGGSTS